MPFRCPNCQLPKEHCMCEKILKRVKTPVIPQVYLAGAIERAKDATSWRNDLTVFLKDYKINIFDPCAEENSKLRGLHFRRLPDGISHWHQFKNSDNPALRKRFSNYMERIQVLDLEAVRNSTMVIVRWDEATQLGGGTHHELVYSYMHHIPIYAIEEYPMPAWHVHLIDKSGGVIFKTMDELKDYLSDELEKKDE